MIINSKHVGGGITPTGNINITDTNPTDVTNYATAQVVDADLIASNIKKDVNILGVVGSFEGGSGEDPMSGTFTLPTPITRVGGLFSGAELPESFTLNLPNTCTQIGLDGSANSLFYHTTGMKHLQINGVALTNNNNAIYSNSVVEDVTFNDGTTIIGSSISSIFQSCTALKTINAVLQVTGISAGNSNFNGANKIENIKFVPNIMTALTMTRWTPSNLTTASIVSLCNALKQGQTATATFNAATKTKLPSIRGTVDTSGDFAVFIETGVPTDIALTDFVTNVKGWTIA